MATGKKKTMKKFSRDVPWEFEEEYEYEQKDKLELQFDGKVAVVSTVDGVTTRSDIPGEIVLAVLKNAVEEGLKTLLDKETKKEKKKGKK